MPKSFPKVTCEFDISIRQKCFRQAMKFDDIIKKNILATLDESELREHGKNGPFCKNGPEQLELNRVL